jgi:DNA-binding response OmpR family regulator
MSVPSVLPRPASRLLPRAVHEGAAPEPSEPPELHMETRDEVLPEVAAARRILVVDDDPGLRLICRFNLEAVGMEVREAPDGETAIAMAVADPPDAILLDVMMPGLDGWAVAAELGARAETRDVPVVFVTARVTEADRARGVELACAAYVTKPFDPSMLAGLIERLVGGGDGG